MAIVLSNEQHMAVKAAGRDILVSAAAGSGKTRVLVERVINRITGSEKRDIDDFLIITFTRAAAAEMKGRILSRLSEMLLEDPGNRHLHRQLSRGSRAHIMTIDSFCLDIVREFSHMCDVGPGFRIAEGAETELLMAEALENTLEKLYSDIDNNPGFATFAALMSADRDDRQLAAVIQQTSENIQSHPFPERWADEIKKEFSGEISDFATTIWGKEILDRANATIESAEKRMKVALEELREEPMLAAKYVETFEADVLQMERLKDAIAAGWDSAAKALEEPMAKLKSAPPRYHDPVFKDKIKGVRDSWRSMRSKLAERICEPESVHIGELKRVFPAVEGLFFAVFEYEKEYKRMKSSRGIVDFNDVSHMAIRLLCDECGEPTEIARGIGDRFCEVMIDEFQDTNGIQDTIVRMLTKGNMFMVGDVKQSIYRFRLAEPEIFLRKYHISEDFGENMPSLYPARILLSKNYRSRNEVIDAVNFVFEKLMIGGFTQIDYSGRERLTCGRDDERDGEHISEFYVIDVPHGEEEEDDPVKAEVEAGFVANRIHELLSSGFMIGSGESIRPAGYGDIAILLRSVAGKAAIYERILRQSGIPVQSQGSGMEQTTELFVIMSLLSVIDNPYQDVPLIAVLRSALYEFSPDELAEIRSAGRESMYEALVRAADMGNERAASFLDELGLMRTAAADMRVDQLIWYIYSKKNLPAIYSAMPGGAMRRKNLNLFFEHAQRYESGEYRGIFGFVSYMEKVFESGTFGGEEEEQGKVRIMTVHKSKGLEFPIVFLCDIARKFNVEDTRKSVLVHPELGIGMRMFDADRMYRYPTAAYMAISDRIREESLAEEMRVLYVAMTRAEDKLIMTCAMPDAKKKIERMLLGGQTIDEELLKTADGPAKWLIPVMAQHPDGIKLREISRDPGFDAKAEGNMIIDVISDVHVEEESESRRDDKNVPEEEGYEELYREIEEKLRFKYDHLELSQIPSKLTATQMKGRDVDEEAAEGARLQARPVGRSARPRFVQQEGLTAAERGTALHVVMQFADYNACLDKESAQRELERLKRMKIISDTQAEAADLDKIIGFVN